MLSDSGFILSKQRKWHDVRETQSTKNVLNYVCKSIGQTHRSVLSEKLYRKFCNVMFILKEDVACY